MSNKMMDTIFVVLIFILMTVACSLATPTPMPTPTLEPTVMWTPIPPFPTGTPTATPTVTPTPIVIIITATPTATPELDPQSLVFVPDEAERFAAQLVPLYGNDFAYFGRLGVTPDTIIYLFYETPAGSGEHHLASYGIVGGLWILSDTVRVVQPTTTSAPTSTPGPGREARK